MNFLKKSAVKFFTLFNFSFSIQAVIVADFKEEIFFRSIKILVKDNTRKKYFKDVCVFIDGVKSGCWQPDDAVAGGMLNIIK